MSAPRVGLIGARRVRQGLGPFVARHLLAAGAEVPAFLGTSASSVQEARRGLADEGLDAVGYTNLDDLLDRESPDALAVLSPAETHERYLRAALRRDLHVLCEKPFTWGGEALEATAGELAGAFAERGLLLVENCQWPHVLPAFEALHGPIGTLERFAMRLTPASRGGQMLGDALPHPLSVLQALRPAEEAWIRDLHLSTRDPDTPELTLEAAYATPGGSVPFRVDLVHGTRLPREASLTINGRPARRRVRLEDYAQFLTDGEREVPLPDPLAAHLERFVADLRDVLAGGAPPSVTPILQRAAALERALHAFHAEP